MNRSIPTGFSCPVDLIEQLEDHLREKGLLGRGMKSQFIRDAIQEKIQRESREALYESKEGKILRDIWWVKHHEDPPPERVLEWLGQGLKFPPGCEPEQQPAPEWGDPSMKEIIAPDLQL